MTENRFDPFLKKHRNAVIFSLALAVFAAFAVCFFINIYQYPYMNAKPAAFICLACSAAACAALVLCYRALSEKDVPTEKMFLIFMITAGILYAVIFLPFTVPDESEHYLSAYRISNYITFNSDQFSDERLLIRSADLELFGKLRSNELTPEYYSLLAKNFHMFVQDKSASFIPSTVTDGTPIGYIAPAIGISLGRFFRLGALPTFYLGRFANLAAYVFIVWLAIKRIPYGKTALFAVSALPTGIHLVSSYSCDATVMALAMLFIAEVLCIRESTDRIKLREIIILTAVAVLLVTSRLICFPILLAVFLIPFDRFGLHGKKAVFARTAIAVIAAVLLLLTLTGNITAPSDGGVSARTGETYSLLRAFSHPLEFFGILINTAYLNADYYASSLVGSHMVGTGSSVLPVFLWAPMLAVLAYSLLRRKGDLTGRFRPSTRFWVFGAAAGYCVLIALSALFSRTPVDADVIRGIHGRLFIPALPLLVIALRGSGITRPVNSDKRIILFCVYFNLLAPLFYFGQMFLN